MQKRFDIATTKTRLLVLITLMFGVVISMILVFVQNRRFVEPVQNKPIIKVDTPKKPAVDPKLTTSEVIGGLSHPWDIAFLPDKTMVFNERNGAISRLLNGQKRQIAKISDVYVAGEGGLTGLVLDANFQANRYLYTCFNAKTAVGLDVRLVRWKVSSDNSSLTDRNDIVTGIPSNSSGRHSGCRVRAASDGTLWIGTGDAAKASNPQDPKSLGGKILHVSRDGMPEPGNLPAPFDPRIFSYGHRNVQGIALFEKPVNGVYGYSIEHGSDVDDEVNLLKSGNFGWAPKITYIETGIPMTDLKRFPGAVSAIWSSGSSTIAPSGGTILHGENWGNWDGALAMAVLKGNELRILRFDSSYKLLEEKSVLKDFGRIRSATQSGIDDLYITTDNGTDDKIVKISPEN